MQKINRQIVLIVWLQFIANYIMRKMATLGGVYIFGVELRKDDLKEEPTDSCTVANLNFVLRRMIRVSTVSYKIFY